MPHIGAGALLTAGATAAAGALGFAGAKSAASAQDKASGEAIALAREQEAERRREWDKQQRDAAYQWRVLQANLKPYRLARAKVLNEYGIDANVEDIPMPADFGGGPSTPSPAMFAPGGKGKGTGGAYMALLAGVPGALGALAQYRGQSPYTQTPGPYSTSEVGAPGGPPGPPAPPQIDPSRLSNWSDWQNWLQEPV